MSGAAVGQAGGLRFARGRDNHPYSGEQASVTCRGRTRARPGLASGRARTLCHADPSLECNEEATGQRPVDPSRTAGKDRPSPRNHMAALDRHIPRDQERSCGLVLFSEARARIAPVQVVLRKIGRGSRAVIGRLVRAPRKGSVVVIEFSDGMHEYVTTPVKRVLRLAGREVFYIETVNSRYRLEVRGREVAPLDGAVGGGGGGGGST